MEYLLYQLCTDFHSASISLMVHSLPVRSQVSPDLPEYIMDENLPNARAVLRRARNQKLGDDFWQEVNRIIDKRTEDD